MAKKIKDCDCLEKMAAMIKKKISEGGNKIIESGFEHRSWYPVVRLYSNYLYTKTFIKVDGTESKPKKGHIAIFYNNCPFCGKKYDTEKFK